MIVIVAYDTQSKNCQKLHQVLCRYLTWNQFSLFSGELSVGELEQLKNDLKFKLDPHGRVMLYKIRTESALEITEIGQKTIKDPRGNLTHDWRFNERFG